MHPLSGVPRLILLEYIKSFKHYLCRHWRRALYKCGTHFDKICQIGLKPDLVVHWLATSIVTCKYGLAIGIDQITRA